MSRSSKAIRWAIRRLRSTVALGVPSGLAATIILTLFAEDSAVLGDLFRPLGAAVVLTLIVQALATLWLRDSLRGAHGAAIIVSTVGHIYWLVGVLMALPVWWLAVGANRRRSGRQKLGLFPIGSIAGLGAIVAGVLLLISVIRVGTALNPWTSDPAAAALGLPGSGGPDIFVLLLDGYPRADTLQRDFGIDNSAFLGSLARAGFAIDESSRANYMKTWLSVASLVHLQYIDDIPIFRDPTQEPVGQYRLATRAIEQAPFADALRARGYEVVVSTSPFTETDLTTADRVLDPGQPTNFENGVMQGTLTARIVEAIAPGFLPSLQVAQAREGLDNFRMVAHEPSPQPVFMFAHIEAPHTPFVVDAKGDPVAMPNCYPISCSMFDHYITTLGLSSEQYGAGLAGYLAYTNEHVLDAIQDVVRQRPDAVVIVMSDHGSRYDPDNPHEHFRNFFAARTPGAADVFPPGTHLVNVFRHLSNAYFDTDFEPLPYRALFSDGLLLNLVEVDVAPAD